VIKLNLVQRILKTFKLNEPELDEFSIKIFAHFTSKTRNDFLAYCPFLISELKDLVHQITDKKSELINESEEDQFNDSDKSTSDFKQKIDQLIYGKKFAKL
jgi:hypothetical protein